MEMKQAILKVYVGRLILLGKCRIRNIYNYDRGKGLQGRLAFVLFYGGKYSK